MVPLSYVEDSTASSPYLSVLVAIHQAKFAEHDVEPLGLVDAELKFDQRERNETHNLGSTSHEEDGLTWLNITNCHKKRGKTSELDF